MSTSKKQTKDPLALRVVRTSFTVLDKLAPPLANRWAFSLFITPFKYPLPERERKVKAEAEQFTFQYDGLNLRAYKWGKGPVVLFMHGWAGRGLQVSELVQPLVDKGFQVVSFDAQAHGASEGKKTNLFLITGAFRALLSKLGTVHTVIGHSFGGTIALYAMREQHKIERVITISTPAVGQGIIDEFLRRINGSARVGHYLRKRITNLTGKSFDEFTAQESAKYLSDDFPMLIIHDQDDIESPIYHAEALKNEVPTAKTFFTKGLGHTRILRNKEVIDQVTSFVMAKDEVLV